MVRRFIPALAALLIFVFMASGCSKEAPTFRVGYMICNSIEETRERFDPLTEYLSQATGARFEAVYLDTVDVEEAFEKGQIDFTHTNSLLFVTLAERHKVKLVASEKRGAFGALTKGTIIVRADSEIETVADLRDKRVVFGPQWAPFGFLSQYALMLEKGIDPEMDLGPYAFPPASWKHEKIVYSVLYGAFAAGAAPLIDLEEMTAEGKIQPGDFKIIATSELAPYCTIGVSSRVDVEWVEKVREALLAVDDSTTAEVAGEKLKILKRAKVTGFEKLDIKAYDILLKWAKLAKMPPYEEPW